MDLALPAVEIVSNKDRKVLHLRGALGMLNASALRDAALKMSVSPAGADRFGTIHVDMRGVESADAAAFQILAAFDAESLRRGHHIEGTGLAENVEGEFLAAGWYGFSRP